MQIAYVFPGQGSQSLGMLGALAQRFPEVEQTFAQASEVLELDLWKLACEGPVEAINRTENTQPLMLAAGVAVARVWAAQGGAPAAMMAGHSLGEYSALVCAGSLDYAQAVRMVAERARLMQNAVPEGEGAMAAIIGLDDDAVQAACKSVADAGVVEAVNFNAPGQVVIAGEKVAVEAAMQAAKAAGAKRALPLPVSVPSHCRLMNNASQQLHQKLEGISVQTPKVPVLHNVDVASHEEPVIIRSALAAQVKQPVRWVETIQAMSAQGITRIIEMGPGKVLTGLNKRIDSSLELHCVSDPESLEAAMQLGRAA
ncbi:[acyl-carrier-protein] S-malonyltransferase [Ectothiorhodosinus mongolicus]|uniref:Malonyl CoA-acyl carrier protein transacylase n=1 Tax=Ectothiorhodosinus mongolicus TaxID=233100 RepID=A0A1R3VPA4_9GAMM|nr:ACP S-malonyltransferase [Ectothiorhodosinus mongolicus]ULX56270.1 [acyl-carrier-protein] S-malonyltransferase [Ectothiorhodosinus mongolicus]SIT65775.1 [acyl-carrier-protein] S-malonyltransferase [Ectothiorhodosinus mongolicus]